LIYHVTVTSGLQAVAKLARLSPLVAVIEAPVGKAERVALRQVDRYPSIGQSHVTRTALRHAQVPAVQMVILPPTDGLVHLLLLSNLVPPESREIWRDGLDPADPLIWRHYELVTTESGRISWRLRASARVHYRQRLARLITGRGRLSPSGTPYQLDSPSARRQVLRLAEHLGRYPGLSGIRADIYSLAQYSTKVWKSTRPDDPYPVWPFMPYLPFLSPRTAPLADLCPHVPSPLPQELSHE